MKITIYKINTNLNVSEIVNRLNNKKFGEDFIRARESKFSSSEVFISYFYAENIESQLKKIVSEEAYDEIVTVLKNNGGLKVIRRVYCFIDVNRKTLEIYRGLDKKTEEIANNIAKCLEASIEQYLFGAEKLIEIMKKHSLEVRQAIFGNINGFISQTFGGRHLERNISFSKFVEKFWNSLIALTIKPKIRFLNGNSKYSVTFNRNKGTIKISNGGEIEVRPRFEVRQIVSLLFN